MFFYREQLRKQIAEKIGYSDYYIVDSIPLEVCKLSRSCRSLVCKDNCDTAPDKGYYTSQSNNYFGYKLHAIYTVDGVFTYFDLTQASVHDIHYFKCIKLMYKDCTILGGKRYFKY